MLKHFHTTASSTVLFFLLAVFFSAVGNTHSGQLKTLDKDLNDLIYELSHSIVTVEAVRPFISIASGSSEGETVHSLISSGIIYDSVGHILVAASSLASRDRITVSFQNSILPASLIGIDHQTGLALIKVDQQIGHPVDLVSRYLCGGQMVIALGNAYGVRASPSLGFCSGVRPEGSIQFTCPITSGTIGGGLFDLNGNLVGMISGSLGEGNRSEVGLALPAHMIPAIVRFLVTEGDRQAGYLGVSTAEIVITPPIELTLPTTLASTGHNYRQQIDRGLMITNVTPGSPADQAGLMKGDLLFSYDKQQISSVFNLKQRVVAARPGSTMELEFIRGNNPYKVDVTIGRTDYTQIIPSLSSNSEEWPYPDDRKSIIKQIEYLKSAIKRLEQKLDRSEYR